MAYDPHRFVGRGRELAELLGLLAAARNGTGRFVTVVGPAGIGKSALVHRLGRDPRHLGTTLATRCLPGDAPLAGWVRILDAAGDAGATAVPSGPVTDQAELPDALLEAWAALAPPVLVVLDDLTLADPASLEVLRTLVPQLATEPVVLVTTIRAPRAGNDPVPTALPLADHELVLGGLGTSELRELLAGWDPGLREPQLTTAATQLLGSTGGVPLAVTTAWALGWGTTAGTDVPSSAGAGSGSVDATLLQAVGALHDPERAVLQLLALAPTLGPGSLAAMTGLPAATVTAALQRCARLGLLGTEPAQASAPASPHPRVAELVASALSDEARAQLHARLAEHLGADAAVPATVVAYHALAGAGHLPRGALADVTERAGREALARGALTDADRFLAAAEGVAGDEPRRLRCLLGRAEAAQRAGDLAASSELAGSASRLARALGDADAMAAAAVLAAYPAEWRAGDTVSRALLAAAEDAAPSPAWLAQVLAIRAVVEMRLPVADTSGDGEEWSWLTRASVGQPLADRALTIAEGTNDATARTMALLAWRSTHRAPRYLDRRREVSSRAQQLAQRIHRLDLLVEAGLRGATDELEAGSRAGFEEGVALVRWAAERSGEPRLLWRAACLDAARGVLDGKLDVLAEHQLRARDIAATVALPGASVADQLFSLQSSLLAGEREPVSYLADQDHPAMRHQLGRAGMALITATLGRPDETERQLERLVRPLDDESSVLLTAALAGRAAAMIGSRDHARWLLTVLSPWRSHVAVDAECLWPAIPVAIVTAQLHQLLGDEPAARQDRARAERSSQILRSPVIARMLDHPVQVAEPTFTERQQQVIEGLAAGRSNAQMALDLGFSVATIRRETSAVYRLLGVSNRAEAVNEAHRRQLV